jgi:hypothetical protein
VLDQFFRGAIESQVLGNLRLIDKWRPRRDHTLPITSIVMLPFDAFGSVTVHSEILFLPDKYLQ